MLTEFLSEPQPKGPDRAAKFTTVGVPSQPKPTRPVPPKHPAHYLWSVLMARIYEVFPLVCPICGGQMRIIAFITYSADIRMRPANPSCA